MNPQQQLLSPKKTAEFFGVSVRTLIEWRKRGIIHAIRIGGCPRVVKGKSRIFGGVVRYHPDEIKRVLKDNRESARSPRRKYF